MSSITERVNQIKEEDAKLILDKISRDEKAIAELARNRAEFDEFGEKLNMAFGVDSLLSEYNDRVLQGKGMVSKTKEEVICAEHVKAGGRAYESYTDVGKFRVSGKTLYSAREDYGVFAGIISPTNERYEPASNYNHPRFVVTVSKNLYQNKFYSYNDGGGLLGLDSTKMMRGTRELSEGLISSGKKFVEEQLASIAESFLRPSQNNRGL